ncbi:MAG: hypothetical protein DMF03_12640, partial [Verrucomicrobia bacterium]
RKQSGAISAVDFVGSLRFGIQPFFEISPTIKAIPLPLGSQSIFASDVQNRAHTLQLTPIPLDENARICQRRQAQDRL